MTRLFLRRLVDNDLISPHADRHESLAVLYGLVVSAGVFATFFLSTNYLAAFVQLPGTAALSALSDRFLFIAASITLSALGALMVWDALALEPRDAAILGPLPIAVRTITNAKLIAAVLFATLLTVGLNAVPSVIYPALLTLNIRGARGATILRLMGAHATTMTMAGLFGFFGVVASRGILRLLAGARGFSRLSSSVHSALVVTTATALLLAPTVRATDVRQWVADTVQSHGLARPVLWYLAVNETAAGSHLAETPIVMPPRFPFLAHLKVDNDAALAIYRPLLPHFAALARRGWSSLLLVAALALATFFWINRRLPDRTAGVPTSSPIRARCRRLAERLTQDDPEAQAGFFFALHTMCRSSPHRTVIAIAVAIGLTHALMVLTRASAESVTLRALPLGILGVGIMCVLALMVGVLYAVSIPAELAANWSIRMAWLGDERSYLAGVKRAATLLAALTLLFLFPLHLALFGAWVAIAHSILDLLFATGALHAVFLRYRKLPFACSYVAFENPKIAWPAGFASLLMVTYGLAAAEQWALQTTLRTITLAVVSAAFVLFVRSLDRAWRRERRPIGFDAGPVRTTQRLGLFEHVATND